MHGLQPRGSACHGGDPTDFCVHPRPVGLLGMGFFVYEIKLRSSFQFIIRNQLVSGRHPKSYKFRDMGNFLHQRQPRPEGLGDGIGRRAGLLCPRQVDPGGDGPRAHLSLHIYDD